MSIAQRLNKLAPNLTAQERAILILEAWKDGRPEDPAWRGSMPQEQTQAFNRYIHLMNVANQAIGRLIIFVLTGAEKIELQRTSLLTLRVWQDQIDDIREALSNANSGGKPSRRTRAELDRLTGIVEDWPRSVYPAEDAQFPGQLIQKLKASLAHQMISTWVMLRCVDALLEDIAGEFNGIDPLRPRHRQKLEEAREQLQEVREHLLSLDMEVVLREPLEEELQEMRDWLASLPAT